MQHPFVSEMVLSGTGLGSLDESTVVTGPATASACSLFPAQFGISMKCEYFDFLVMVPGMFSLLVVTLLRQARKMHQGSQYCMNPDAGGSCMLGRPSARTLLRRCALAAG